MAPSASSTVRPGIDHAFEFDVVVVGAGHVGSAFALSAAMSGLHVALLSGPAVAPSQASWADETWDRRVYALGPATRDFLASLRIWDQLDQARVTPVYDMRIFDDAPASAELHFAAYEANCEALAWIVEHRELTRVLDVALGYQQRVERLALPALALETTPDGARVKTPQGALTAQLVVGADGARSFVRDAAQIKAHVKSYEQTGVVANFRVDRVHGGVAHQWFVEGGVVALLPLAGDVVSLVWSAPNALATRLMEEGPEALAARLCTIAAAVFASFEPIGGISGFPLSQLRTDALIAERVALVGDAAHVVHPLAGQGLNLGFDDARALARALAAREAHRSPGDRVVLRRYERERAEAIWAMTHMTDGLHRLFGSTDPMLRRARARGLLWVDRLPGIKEFLARSAMG